MSQDEPLTSAVRRFLKLGGLVGRVGASMLGNQLLELGRSEDSRRAHRTEALLRNATRVAETLGRMKGAAMKVGQMLSLHEGLLPPEVAEVLRTLQKQAPDVPFEVMRYEIEGQLDDFDRLFASLEPEPIAAASIGQVHRGRLRDGRDVAVKIQYPLIEEIIKADLHNLRTVLHGLFSLFSEVPFDPVWREVRDRLLEELDYEQEAENIRTMAGLHAGVESIVIPRVIEEASTRRVLTMEYLQGAPPDEACSQRYPQELRDRWGVALFDFQLRGLFAHRLLHADPNLANFSFLEDGRIVVYDFGCVKRVPERLARGYAALTRAVLSGRTGEIPGILKRMGVHRERGTPLPLELTDPYAELFAALFREGGPYPFGEGGRVYRQLFDLGLANWSQAADIRFPKDVIFVNRSLSGHFGNLSRLRARERWRDRLLSHVGDPER